VPLGAVAGGAGCLELAFESKLLRALCEQEIKAKKELGEDTANALRRRIADLRAASSVEDLLVGRPRFNSDDGEEHLILDLGSAHTITVAANHVKNPVTASGNLDWSKISRVKIVKIEGNVN
jgi:hypothetical protein